MFPVSGHFPACARFATLLPDWRGFGKPASLNDNGGSPDMTRFLSASVAICLLSLPAIAENVSTGDVYACAAISGDEEA
tara:strand:- start:59857 stop:60093 length:237 start_codon:yes stop_codon:yes gene_type:complete